MSEAHSLTALSETDYDAIAQAVMETARGRWFMTEYARRNRQADTAQLLTAIQKIERAVGVAPARLPEPDSSLSEAAFMIADLRLDLERVSGRGEPASSGLATRVETSAGQILIAAESIQDAAWRLREAGADDALCDLLDRRTTEIFAAAATVESSAQQIDKIGDTIAMLDSSLRAFGDREQRGAGDAHHPVTELDLRPVEPLSAYADIDIVEIDTGRRLPGGAALSFAAPLPDRPVASLKPLDDDIVFAENQDRAPAADERQAAAPMATARAVEPAQAGSEADLHALDALPADRKLAYFA